MQLMIIIMINK